MAGLIEHATSTDGLQGLGLLLLTVLIYRVWRHEQAHCAQIGQLEAENRAMRRLLNIDEEEMQEMVEREVTDWSE